MGRVGRVVAAAFAAVLVGAAFLLCCTLAYAAPGWACIVGCLGIVLLLFGAVLALLFLESRRAEADRGPE